MPRPYIDLTGKIFSSLTVLKVSPTKRGKNTEWICKCVCGKEICISGTLLTCKKQMSCGCLKLKYLSESHKKHGHASLYGMGGKRKPEYMVWQGMKQRCYYDKCISYHNYGGRGIKVCKRWKDSFENFLKDMGNRPTPKHSLDRINPNKNYCKSNCRWATSKQQSINKRHSVYITINGVKKHISEWAEETKVPHARIRQRLYRGYSQFDSVYSPHKKHVK